MSKKLSSRSSVAWVGASLVSFALLVSCTGGDNGFTNNDDCDYIMAPGITTGQQQITTDRQCPSALALDLKVNIDFRSGSANQPPANERSQFYVAFYDVTYRNDNTGGTIPGVDVPAPIRLPLATVVDPGGTAEFTGWPILEAGQKLNAPLNDESYYGPGGTPMTVTLTWWGWPVTNPDAICFGVMTWQITVYSSGPIPPGTEEAFFGSCE